MASTVTELLRRRFGGKKAPQITYIENPSTAYIDTGIPMTNVAKIVATFSHHTGGFLTGYNGALGATVFFIYNNIVQWATRPSGYTINNGAKHSIELSNGVFVLDGVTRTFAGGNIKNANNTRICADGSGDSRRSTSRIYAFDLLDINGNYLFKGSPAYEGGRYGLKDAVSGNFFGSASDVEFIGA
jgi:hypothetical protein